MSESNNAPPIDLVRQYGTNRLIPSKYNPNFDSAFRTTELSMPLLPMLTRSGQALMVLIVEPGMQRLR